MTAARRRSERRGHQAEAVAAWWLRAKGYRILARRSRHPVGEIDLVARRGRVLAFVEVKARATRAAAVASLTARQRERIARAAQAFVAARPGCAGLAARFDLVVVARGRPVHIPNAWHILD